LGGFADNELIACVQTASAFRAFAPAGRDRALVHSDLLLAQRAGSAGRPAKIAQHHFRSRYAQSMALFGSDQVIDSISGTQDLRREKRRQQARDITVFEMNDKSLR